MNILKEKSNLTRLIQTHKGFQPFNYDICIDWAISLLEKEVKSNNVVMLASFSKPANAWEIRPYIQAVLKEFNLEEFEGEKATKATIYYYVWSILNNYGDLISNLDHLRNFCTYLDYEDSIYPFYFLRYSWEDLEEFGLSFHYKDVTYNNFNDTVLKEAKIWMENFEKISRE